MLFYEHFADSYDDMINWRSRLELEQVDLQKILKANGVENVLDAGCGTGMHLIYLTKLGFNVIGIDNNEVMLEKARQNAEKFGVENSDLRLGSFLEIDSVVKEQMDCVVCLGNSLPHMVDDGEIVKALEQFFQVIKPGGLCVIQIVHFDHYLDSADSAVAVSEGIRNGREVTFRRHYEFKGTKVIFHVSIYDRGKRELLENYNAPLNAIRKDLLQTFLENVGFTTITMCRDFSMAPIKDKDRSLVVFARRPVSDQ